MPQRRNKVGPRTLFCFGVLFFSSALLPCFSLRAQQSSPPSGPAPIRVDVNRVNVGAIVTAPDGKFLEGLRREDFLLLDDGVPQPITDFLSIDEPASVLVLIEAGPSVYLLEGGHLSAVYGLLEGLSSGDRVAVVQYDEAPKAIADFSADKRATTAAFQRLNFNLGFGQLNLASCVGTVLDWLEKTPGKKTIVLLSTGVDTSPSATAENLLRRLRAGDVRIEAVSLAAEMRAPPPAKKRKAPPTGAELAAAKQFAEADQALNELTAATGGTSYFPTNATEFAAAYAEIARNIRHEYSLGFIPAHNDGQMHRLEVRLSKPAAPSPGAAAPSRGVESAAESSAIRVKVRYRQAYIAPKADAP